MSKPLSNRTILITRSAEQSESSINIFKESGANVIQFPTIKITAPESFNLFDNAVKNFCEFDYLIFTSENAVKKFAERINELKISLNYEKIKIVVTGSKTAEICKEKNIKVDFIPDEYSAEAIIENLKEVIKNKKVFIPCSAIARKELSEGLKRAGAVVTKVPVYEVGIPDEDEIKKYVDELNKNFPDVFVFTSPSTFKNFLSIMKINNPKNYFKNFIVAAIGATTETAIKEFDVNVNIVPKIFTVESLAEEIINYFGKINLTIEHK